VIGWVQFAARRKRLKRRAVWSVAARPPGTQVPDYTNEVPTGPCNPAHASNVPEKPGAEGEPSGGLAPVADASQGPVDVSSAAGAPPGGAPPNPRASLASDLAGCMARLLAAGDVEGARIAHETIGKLLAAGPSGAVVLDLATERRRRDR
jgi:hypothetical protein